MQKESEEHYILNEKNKLITLEYINNMLVNYGVSHKIKKLDDFHTAMTHESYLVRSKLRITKQNKLKQYLQQLDNIDPIVNPSSAIPLRTESYERLEFLGDSVLHMGMAEYLYKRYEHEDEGFMTRLRTKIENGDTLSIFARSLKLHEYLVVSRYIESIGYREKNNSIIEDIFEAFIGALYLDANYDVCRQLLFALFESHVDFSELLKQETNYKDMLLQYFDTQKWCHPEYGATDISGPESKKVFTMYVKCKKRPSDDGEIIAYGTGPSKRKGEQESAKLALIQYGVIKNAVEDATDVSYEEYESDNE